MRLSTLVDLGWSGKLGLMARVMGGATTFYKLAFLAGAARCGALVALRDGPRDPRGLRRDLGLPEEGEAFDAWLETGVRLGVLKRGPAGLALDNPMARALAREEHDDLLAFVEEALTLHHALLLETPTRLREGRGFTMADQDGTVVARSSRILEPLLREVLDRTLPREPGARLLEIGCGSGVYLRHALESRPSLTALGLELQAPVAALARDLVDRAGLSERAEIREGDVRHERFEPTFDLATLHNNIYYFPVEDRVALLRHVRGALKPGGSLLLTTGCQEGSAAMSILSLWGAVTEGCGRLPGIREMEGQMREAGFEGVRSESLVPGDAFCAFVGRNP